MLVLLGVSDRRVVRLFFVVDVLFAPGFVATPPGQTLRLCCTAAVVVAEQALVVAAGRFVRLGRASVGGGLLVDAEHPCPQLAKSGDDLVWRGLGDDEDGEQHEQPGDDSRADRGDDKPEGSPEQPAEDSPPSARAGMPLAGSGFPAMTWQIAELETSPRKRPTPMRPLSLTEDGCLKSHKAKKASTTGSA